MKKIVTFSVIALVAAGALSSCKKTYVCKFTPVSGQPAVETEYPKLTKDQAEGPKTSCAAVGGTWSVK